MDLQSFLELEKRTLIEERQDLYAQLQEHNSSVVDNASMDLEIKNAHQPKEDTLSKQTKDWINKQHNNKKTEYENLPSNDHKEKNQDDMEQWVSDTFYSYFPGFNNEYQKRQNELQKKQRQNQENLIKHQMLNNNQSRTYKHYSIETSNINSSRSNNSSLRGTGKTDMEIINVNNPDYIPSKHSSNSPLRPDSARYRLLQDLRHTNLTNLVNASAEDTMEINRRKAEIECARKKEYQQELMQQIEEKRRTIKLLKDKEYQQEEALTKRLQEQLKTIRLEEQLEKERINAVNVRYDTEQNRLKREQLLAKLENDSQLISSADSNPTCFKEPIALNNGTDKENNKVYRYFSNAEKHDYSYRKKSSSLPMEIDLEFDHSQMEKIERECFHLSEKICPMCDEPLKELENFCLRCQTKISFRIRSPLSARNTTKECNNQKTIQKFDKNPEQRDTKSDRSFFLVCIRCERLYSWCKTCTNKSDVCKACQNKRNLCMTCRKTLCSFCLEEIACGKDTENTHINDSIDAMENVKEMSFQVMNNNREREKNDNKSSNISPLSTEDCSLNNFDFANDPPYSINIDQNSVFHPDKPYLLSSKKGDKNLKTSHVDEKNSTFYNKGHFSNSDDKNIEKLRHDTDKRLIRYLKNYGDLAYKTRGTQTTPTTTGRRDIVIKGEHTLSIPLLREMPKMIRTEKTTYQENSRELKDLLQRWDVPAVQKFTISPLSPKVVTQVGAIRKQLQIDRIFSEGSDSQ